MPHAHFPQFTDLGEDWLAETLAIEAENEGLGLEIDARTILPKWSGERLDYSIAADASSTAWPPPAC